ncbi:MAG: cysteine hydrolase [Betaproteobacteria bacterium]|nr:cysteine hydrolase [Betaproteobacteria bacterium]
MKIILNRQVLDTLPELVDPRHAAVVVIDIQNDFCSPKGHFARYGKDVARMQPAVDRAVSFVAQAQTLGMRCIFLQQASLPDGRMDSPAWLRFKTRDGKAPDYAVPGTWGWRFVDGLTVRDGDWVVEKFRPDGFIGTNLDRILRTQGIQSLILLGTTTEGCVESTVRAASYHDYYTVVVSDAVASPIAELHEGSLRFFRARYPIHTADEILAAIRAA